MPTTSENLVGTGVTVVPNAMSYTKVDEASDVKFNISSATGIIVQGSIVVDDGRLPGDTTQVPDPPVLKAVAGDGTVALSIVNPVAGAQYTFYRWLNVVLQGPATGTSFTDTGLTDGTAYTYHAKITTADGTSDFSAGVTVTPQSVTLPPPKSGFSALIPKFNLGFGANAAADLTNESQAIPQGVGLSQPLGIRVYRNYFGAQGGASAPLKAEGGVQGGIFMSGSYEETQFNAGHPISLSVSNGRPPTDYINAKPGSTVYNEVWNAAARIGALQFGVGNRPYFIRLVFEHEMDAGMVPATWRSAFKAVINIFWAYFDQQHIDHSIVRFGPCPTHAVWHGGNPGNWFTEDMEPYFSFWGTDLYNDSGLFQDKKTQINWGKWTSFQTKYEHSDNSGISLPQWASGKRPSTWSKTQYPAKPVAVLEVNCVSTKGPVYWESSTHSAPTGTNPDTALGISPPDDTSVGIWWYNFGEYLKTATEIDEVLVFSNPNGFWDASYQYRPKAHGNNTSTGLIHLAHAATGT